MDRHQTRIAGILVRIIVILIFALEQAACTKATLPTTHPISINPTSVNPTPPNPILGDENVVITFTDYESTRSLYEPVMAEFHKQNPSITVQFVALPESSSGGAVTASDYYRTQAAAADTSLTFGSGPDVSGYFRDLQPQIDADPGFKPDDFWPRALSGCQDANGHTWGVPMTLILTGIYYDEQAFTAAGLPAPKPGWTWDEFRQDATALAKQSGDAIRYGYADMPTGNSNSILTPLLDASLAANGGEIDPQALAKVSQWYLDLARAKVLYPITGMEWTQQVDDQWKALLASVENRPAMWAGSLSYSVPGKDAGTTYAISEYGFAPFPVAAGGSNSNTTPLVTRCAVVSANSLHPAGTWAWVSFLSRQWLVQDPTKLNDLALMPARQSVAEAGGFWTNLPVKAEPAVRYGLAHGDFLGLYLTAIRAVDVAVQKAAAGQTDFATALAEARAELALASQPAVNSPSVVVATAEPTQDVAANTAVVNFYPGTDPAEYEALKVLAKQFNQAHPDMVVKVSNEYPPVDKQGRFVDEQGHLIGNDYAAFGKKYDCFILQNDPVGAGESGAVLSLNALLDAEGPSFMQDFYSALLDASRYQGELFDLPLTTQPTLMSYNADLLAKRGLQSPSNDWTFADFLRLMQAATSTSETDKSYGYMGGAYLNIYDLLLASRNVQWLDQSGNLPMVKLDTPELAAALAWMAGLVKAGVIYSDYSQDWWLFSHTFSAGQVAFWDSVAGATNGGDTFISPGATPSFKTGFVPLPVMPSGSGAFQGSRDRGIYISQQARNPQACWTWIKFLTEQPTAFHGVPARKSMAASPAWEASVGAEAAAIYRLAAAQVKREDAILSYAQAYIKFPLGDWFYQAETAALQGDDPTLLLTEGQRKADVYLACLQTVDFTKLSRTELKDKIAACAVKADPQWNNSF